VGDRLRRERSHRTFRTKYPTLRLEKDEGEVVTAEAWVKARGVGDLETFHGDPLRGESAL
jgi:hypothetical protein